MSIFTLISDDLEKFKSDPFYTSLESLCLYKCTKIIKFVVDNNPDILYINFNKKKSLLYFCFIEENIELIDYFLKKNDLILYCTDPENLDYLLINLINKDKTKCIDYLYNNHYVLLHNILKRIRHRYIHGAFHKNLTYSYIKSLYKKQLF